MAMAISISSGRIFRRRSCAGGFSTPQEAQKGRTKSASNFFRTRSAQVGTAVVSGKEAKETKAEEAKPRFQLYGWVEGSVTGNLADPDDKQNFGRLFDDRSNEVLLNQVVITAERLLAPEPGQWDWGF